MFLLLAIVQICVLYTSVDGFKATVCEGGHLPLACSPDTYISVTSAMYGRLDKTTCPYGNVSNTTCSVTAKTLSALQALCNGQKTCDVDALSYFFTEPCAGIYKYLTFEYSCMPCVNTYGYDADCEMWALYGECNGENADWMAKYCSKACFKCESVIDSACTNVGDDANCTLMANKGDCYSNSAYMGAYCKKACQQCDQPTVCANKATDTECKTRSAAQECSKKSDYMLSNCTKTCFNCTNTIKCEDKDPMCAQWAMQGKCKSDPGTMMTQCTQSCLGCTADPVCSNVDSQCDYYATTGECSKNPVWMYRNCWKSCVNCSSPHVCANVKDDALCEVWAANGECSFNPVYMLSNCRLSCTRCKALEYGRPKCINALFNDSTCLMWTQRNECTNNPGFMLKYCYQMCTKCYSPYVIGNNAAPGEAIDLVSKYTYVMPYEFTTAGQLTGFSAFFDNTNPIYIQILRPNGSSIYSVVHSEFVIPSGANQAQDIKVRDCVMVNATDRLGFTSFVAPASIAVSISKDINSYDIRESASVGDYFYTINAPVKISLAAEFLPGDKC